MNCKRCGCKLRFPVNRGVIKATCPKCRYTFQYDSGPKPTGTSKASQSGSNYKRGTGSQSRVVTITRKPYNFNGWGIFGLQYRIKALRSIPIYINERFVGTLNKKNKITIEIDCGEYQVRSRTKFLVYSIPAGIDDYIVTYVDGLERPGIFGIEPVNDAFRDKLTEFMIDLFRSNSIQSQLGSSTYDGVNIFFDEKYIRLSWRVHNFIHSGDFFYNYSDAGLTPPTDKPSGYLTALELSIKDAILADNQAGITEYSGALILRSRINRY